MGTSIHVNKTVADLEIFRGVSALQKFEVKTKKQKKGHHLLQHFSLTAASLALSTAPKPTQ